MQGNYMFFKNNYGTIEGLEVINEGRFTGDFTPSTMTESRWWYKGEGDNRTDECENIVTLSSLECQLS